MPRTALAISEVALSMNGVVTLGEEVYLAGVGVD
jgi:hypothetical protein